MSASSRRPRLLVLAYSFPPRNAIGCIRAYNMAKWLTFKGWEVTVVTPYESAWGFTEGGEELDADLSRRGIRCMRTGHRWRWLLSLEREQRNHFLSWAAGGVSRRIASVLGIERETGWIADVARACAGLAPEDVDLILASGPPFASFGVAMQLAERLDRPYVLDYRDLWTRNPHAERFRRRWIIAREKQVLSRSAAIIGVSPSLVRSMQNQFGMTRGFHVVSNGYDPDELGRIRAHTFGHFAIVYTGVFYPPKRTVEPLMAALQRLDQLNGDCRPWAFHYYGPQGDYVRERARRFRVEKRVVIHGSVSRPEALAAVRGANVAVVISSVYEQGSLEDLGIVTGKVFDAIGAGTPLLVIAPEGSDLEQILAVTGLGERYAGTHVERIARYLRSAMDDGGRPAGNPDAFSWATIAGRLDTVLRGVLDTDWRCGESARKVANNARPQLSAMSHDPRT